MYVGMRDLRRARGRFVLVASVIGLITLLTVILSGLTAGLGADSASAVRALPGTTVVFAAAPGTSPSFDTSTVSTDELQALAAATGPGQVEGLGISRSTLDTGAATPIPVALFGVPAGGFQAAAIGSHDLGPDTILVASSAAADAGLVAGDHVSLPGGAPLTVAIGPDLSFSHSPVAWIELSSWQATTSHPDSVTVAVATAPAMAGIVAEIGGLAAVPTAEASSAIASYSQESMSLNLINGFLIVISALVVGAFFTVWTIQRTRDIAILKALGASDQYLLYDSLGQAVLVLAFASGLGALLGLGAGALLGQVVPFSQTISTVGVPVAATSVLGLAGAAIAIRSITSVDPMAALGSAR